MDNYYEHTVYCKQSAGKNAVYMLCWALMVVFLLVAAVLASGIIANQTDVLRIRWLNLIGMAACIGLAILVFRRKDALRMEYDYLLDHETLEIFGIYNKSRRRKLASIHISHVKSMGPANGSRFQALKNMRGVKVDAWHGENPTHYLYYTEENTSHAALLELDEQLTVLIRRQLPVGAWQSEGE